MWQTGLSNHHPFLFKRVSNRFQLSLIKKKMASNTYIMFAKQYLHAYNIYVNIATTKTVSMSSVCTGHLIFKTPLSFITATSAYLRDPSHPPCCRVQVGRWHSGSSRSLISRAPGRLCSRGGWALLSHPAQVFSLPAWHTQRCRLKGEHTRQLVHCFRVLGRNFIEYRCVTNRILL